MNLRCPAQGSVELCVKASDTAAAHQSGDVDVLATPRLVALCEEASCAALVQQLRDGKTTVGSRVELSHVAPVAVGSVVRATATLERSEGKRLVFSVSVTDQCGLVAAGKITRVLVDRSTFLERAR